MTDNAVGKQQTSLGTSHKDNASGDKPIDKPNTKINGGALKDDPSEPGTVNGSVSKVEKGKSSGTKATNKKIAGLTSDDRDEQHHERREPTEAEIHSRISPSPFKTSRSQTSIREDRTTARVKEPDVINIKAEEFDWENAGPKAQLKVEEANQSKNNQPAINTYSDRQMLTDNVREHNQSCAEDSSFPLFNHSFDSLSETGHYLKDGSNRHHLKENDEFSLTSPTCSDRPLQAGVLTPKIDITLPNLSQDQSDCSLGDISPIRFAHHEAAAAAAAATAKANGASHHQRKGQHLPQQTVQATKYHQGQQRLVDSRQTTSHYQRTHLTLQSKGVHVLGTYDYNYSQDGYLTEGQPHISNPYYVIRSCQQVFAGFAYILPCLRETDLISVNISRYGQIRHRQNPERFGPKNTDLTIATRRIETAICLFGGSLSPRPLQTSSIFRLRDDGSSKQKYDRCLSQRYHLTDGRISWDVEENPPVESERDSCEGENCTSIGKGSRSLTQGKFGATGAPHVIGDDNTKGKQSGSSISGTTTTTSSALENKDVNKMKYRCKLCGQPKQKHNCPYSQSLQRNIGVMVHAAVNAYTASEPGSLAPALSKMNNFVSYDYGNSSPEEGPHPADSRPHQSQPCQTSTVTPQTVREGGMMYSPQSSLSTHSQEMSPRVEAPCKEAGARSGDRKRSHAQIEKQVQETKPIPPKRAHFAPSVQLRPEHYRAVTRKTEESATAYQYAPVPVTFTERKRLSDTLFFLSREIPSMTSQCALVLREAREKDDWDQAVAELLTQVIVGLYCGEGDSQLDGLQQYLLALGVSC